MTADSKRRPRFVGDAYLGFLYPLVSLIGLYWFLNSFFLAKRSLSNLSGCFDGIPLLQGSLGLTDNEITLIRDQHLLSNGKGCWMDRRVDSVIILVVDALRFDFARDHLPQSVGSRLSNSSSQLLHFVADPPTVTMQRLKGITTGGLPTFADISANFGGATVDEDSWVSQLHRLSASSRGLVKRKKLAFVGDDTWIDLFPTEFDDAHPFPSFNTRDLNTVDNGCLTHLPRLLDELQQKEVELIVAHFLGVDHVGHTYGPLDKHMDEKLKQMDTILDTTLDMLDKVTDQCSVAFVFGDHGMTEDGNHGGGSDEETNAALFVHFSPACGDMSEARHVTGTELGGYAEQAFASISQIDFVPTISILMGLPIPYENLGGIVPSLFPPKGKASIVPSLAVALALNAAQVWNYFTQYSKNANRLPNLPELQSILDDAVITFKEALSHPEGQDSLAYRKACAKLKIFLQEATQLGRRVWTKFDTMGMLGGVTILFLVLLLTFPVGLSTVNFSRGHLDILEAIFTGVFTIFHSVLLTFSNSYIEGEMHVVMFFISVLAIAISSRIQNSNMGMSGKRRWLLPLVVPICSRIGELVVSGHGLDPSIRLHLAHHPAFFLTSLGALILFRIWIYRHIHRSSTFHLLVDTLTLLVIAQSWWEKRMEDANRNGYFSCRVALVILLVGIPCSAVEAVLRKSPHSAIIQFSFKVTMAIIVVTGPSAISSVLLLLLQSSVIFRMASIQDVSKTSAPVLACLWRFVIRHVFFLTNHGCAFSRLQYSSAFIATSDFNFVLGGVSLFLNTFGWEIIGLVGVYTISWSTKRPHLLKFYCFYQLLETVFSCVSVSLLRRHLMVWATFAPRFLFSAIFYSLHAFAALIATTIEVLQ